MVEKAAGGVLRRELLMRSAAYGGVPCGARSSSRCGLDSQGHTTVSDVDRQKRRVYDARTERVRFKNEISSSFRGLFCTPSARDIGRTDPPLLGNFTSGVNGL